MLLPMRNQTRKIHQNDLDFQTGHTVPDSFLPILMRMSLSELLRDVVDLFESRSVEVVEVVENAEQHHHSWKVHGVVAVVESVASDALPAEQR